MKDRHLRIIRHATLAIALSAICCADALAAEKAASWRGAYDTIMIWINFGILAFVVVKFGRTPITEFLQGRKAELAREIHHIEEQKKEITSRINDTYRVLDESDARFKALKDKIVEQGEKKKQEIIEDAKAQSRLILQMAKQKIENRIVTARDKFKAELVDAAIETALKRMPSQITESDNEKLIEIYLASASE